MITARSHAFPAPRWPIRASLGFLDHQLSSAAYCGRRRATCEPAAFASLARRARLRGATVRQASFRSLGLGGFRRFDLVMLAQDLLDLGGINGRVILERVIADLVEVFGGKLFFGAGHLQRLHFNGHNPNHRASGHVGIAADEVAANLAALAGCPVLSLRRAARLVTLHRTIGIGGQNDMGHRLGGFAADQVQNVHGSSPRFDRDTIRGPLGLLQAESDTMTARKFDTPEAELKALKLALWRWSNAKTYADGCQRWRELSELIGIDLAQPEAVANQPAEEARR